MKIGVIGSGSWGTALVKILTDNGCHVTWCVRSLRMADHIRTRHHNPKYLSSIYFSNTNLEVVDKPEDVYTNADAIVIAVPSAYVNVSLFVVCVKTTLLTLEAVAAPNTGATNVLLDKVSIPSLVANVPVVGSVTSVAAVALNI